MGNVTIINISNHKLTDAQTINGQVSVIEMPDSLKDDWSQLTPDKINDVVLRVKSFIQDSDNGGKVLVHIAGQPSAVLHLVNECSYMEKAYNDCTLVYGHSVRNSVESVVDGVIVKKNVFDFQGWYSYTNNTLVELKESVS